MSAEDGELAAVEAKLCAHPSAETTRHTTVKHLAAYLGHIPGTSALIPSIKEVSICPPRSPDPEQAPGSSRPTTARLFTRRQDPSVSRARIEPEPQAFSSPINRGPETGPGHHGTQFLPVGSLRREDSRPRNNSKPTKHAPR